MKVIGIGDLVVDYYFENGVFKGICGGMTAFNVIAHLASNFETYAYGSCGNDYNGEIAIRSLKDVGVNTEYIKREDINTRCFYISVDTEKNIFESRKSCPLCGQKKWYDVTKLNDDVPSKLMSKDSIFIIDTINKVNLSIAEKCKKKKAKVVLDFGQIGNFKYLTKDEVIEKLTNRFDLVQLNERVAVFLMNKFEYKSYIELNKIFNSSVLIITQGKQGATIVSDGKEYKYNLKNVEEELDPSGAGDAFLSIVIKKYIMNGCKLSKNEFDTLFYEASDLSSKVVQKLGARSTLIDLYPINVCSEKCVCGLEAPDKKGRQIKKVIVNLTHLKSRVKNALASGAYEELMDELEKVHGTTALIGTGGSKIPALFASKVINMEKAITTIFMNPREAAYRNNDDITNVFAFSYSGLTEDILYALGCYSFSEKVIITKGKKEEIIKRDPNVKVISYNNSPKYAGKERGFLSFEGILAPCSLFMKKFFNEKDFEVFFDDRIEYWNDYFERYFKENNDRLSIILSKKGLIDIFYGDNCECAGFDLESKIVESGIYRVETHEKKDFSHGRFITLEHYEPDAIIYLRNKSISKYEEKLLDYLSAYKDKLIILQSEYDGIFGEFDLLIGTQYFIKNIAKLINIDISKPSYSDDSMKLYKFKSSSYDGSSDKKI